MPSTYIGAVFLHEFTGLPTYRYWKKTEVATGEEEESRRRCGSTRTRTTYSRDESRAQSYWKINFRIERVTDFKYNNEFPFESGIIRARTGRLINQTQSTLIHQ